MEDTETLKVKVVNKLTGEITEKEVKSIDDAKDLYLELSASETAIKNAKKKLAGYLDFSLGQDESYQFGDGKVLRRVQRESMNWTFEGLRGVGLDEDAITTVTKVDMKLARPVVSEMIERGDIAPNSIKTLNESADRSVTKPFVEIR